MRKRGKGFTIVELMVTITILLVLTTIVVARLLLTQTGGQDQERNIDTSSIATGLEIFYQDGDLTGTISKGYYPGALQVQAAAITTPPFDAFLDGVPQASFEAPDRNTSNSFGVDPNYASAAVGANPDGSYSDAQARALFPTYNYLYQPLKRNNTFCANYADCVKFNLYYLKQETDTVVKIRSKNQ